VAGGEEGGELQKKEGKETNRGEIRRGNRKGRDGKGMPAKKNSKTERELA